LNSSVYTATRVIFAAIFSSYNHSEHQQPHGNTLAMNKTC